MPFRDCKTKREEGMKWDRILGLLLVQYLYSSGRRVRVVDTVQCNTIILY